MSEHTEDGLNSSELCFRCRMCQMCAVESVVI